MNNDTIPELEYIVTILNNGIAVESKTLKVRGGLTSTIILKEFPEKEYKYTHWTAKKTEIKI